MPVSSKPKVNGSTRRARPGGRSQRVGEAVAKATVAVLVRRGFEGFSIPEVAAKAGVNPTSIYRRWRNRETLLVEVLSAHADATLTMPDTGSLRADLVGYLQQAAGFLQTPFGSALLQLGALAMRRPELQPYRRTYWESRVRLIEALFARATERGEVRPGVDPAPLVERLFGPLYVRLLFTGQAIDTVQIEAVVDSVLRDTARTSRGARPARRD
ncbi:MAG: TetR/AcrR family transcriptional regulator [Anaerolineales bacterium]|nr:TetR/AcrR family transcriptional regulator [Anaerolineales bacterium]